MERGKNIGKINQNLKKHGGRPKKDISMFTLQHVGRISGKSRELRFLTLYKNVLLPVLLWLFLSLRYLPASKNSSSFLGFVSYI